jgi:hypothetical protein
MFYADVTLEAGAEIEVPAIHEERAAYIVEGAVRIGRTDFDAAELIVLKPGQPVTIGTSGGGARLMLLGGEPMDGPRHIWWNFVSSSRDRIEQAKRDWQQGRFERVPGETDFIPLPGPDPAPVRYP